MISALDESIRHLLIKHAGLSPTEVDIVFEVPDREWSAGIVKPTVNCYLFDLHENTEFRETDWDVERQANGTSIKRQAPVRIDIAYMITVWSRAVEDEHYLLWRVLAALMRHRVLPADVLQGDLAGHPFPIRAWTAQKDGVLANPADVWTALENQLKPYIGYTVTLALDLEMIARLPTVSLPPRVAVEDVPRSGSTQ
ncbi:MAG: DUF4255 domain-containing protein [Dehalococcoidales bacterium]|nr:DUF4255 domain-containing protein [Dehalococcoidales bacterium]